MALESRWTTAPTDPRLRTAATDARLRPIGAHGGRVRLMQALPVAAAATGRPQPGSARARTGYGCLASRGLTGALPRWRTPPHVSDLRSPGPTCRPGNRIDGSQYGDNLQEALDWLAARGGGLLWLPPRTYFLDRPLTVAAGGIRIAGGGPGTRILLRSEGAQTAVIEVRPGSGGPVHIHDLLFQGLPNVEAALDIRSAEQPVRVSRTTFLDFRGQAVRVTGNSRPIVFDDLDARRCGTGMLLEAARWVTVSSARFSALQSGGAALLWCQAVSFRSCRFEEGPAFGIHAAGTHSLVVVDSQFIRNALSTSLGQITARPFPRLGGNPKHLCISGCQFVGSRSGIGVSATDVVGLYLHSNRFVAQRVAVELSGEAARGLTLLGNQFVGEGAEYDTTQLGQDGRLSLRTCLELENPVCR